MTQLLYYLRFDDMALLAQVKSFTTRLPNYTTILLYYIILVYHYTTILP